MNIIPFEGGSKLPAYLKQVDVAALNADLTAHAGGGFPVMSIKGKVFAVVRDGERKVLTNPKDPDSAATAIEAVIIKANKGTSKVFYLKGYDPESSEKQKPDCYSTTGVEPAADAKTPQSKKCATCPHNQWGSRITDKGTSKGKACSDTVRLAIAPGGQINDPMLLRVPPASIRGLGEYGQMLAKRGVAYNMVLTRIGFDMEAESPKLTFKPVGILDDASFEQVREMMDSDTVRDITGGSLNTAIDAVAQADVNESTAAAEAAETAVTKAKTASKSKTVTTDEVETAVAAAEKAAPKAEKAKPKPTPVEDLDVDLEGIDFDD
jgi:hypothetical protein